MARNPVSAETRSWAPKRRLRVHLVTPSTFRKRTKVIELTMAETVQTHPRLTPAADPVAVTVVAGRAYVWAATDVERLRTHHNISGILIGTLPSVAQQNVFLGLPLQLLPEEVYVLVKHCLAVLVDDTPAHSTPTFEQEANAKEATTTWQQEERRRVKKWDEARDRAMRERYKDKIEAAAEVKKQKKAPKPDSDSECDEKVKVEELDELTEALHLSAPDDDSKDEVKSSTTTAIFLPTQLSSSSPPVPSYKPQLHTYPTLESARDAGLWAYPSTPLQTARCKVYQDLWKRGKFIGPGLKFGCDFLVYPGDTLRYHSHFALTVFPSPDTPINPLDIVSWGRLATAVKKAHALATFDSLSDRVIYSSLEWAGMG